MVFLIVLVWLLYKFVLLGTTNVKIKFCRISKNLVLH